MVKDLEVRQEEKRENAEDKAIAEERNLVLGP